MSYILSYDRKTDNDPLAAIVEILFNHVAKDIRKVLASTLSFEHDKVEFLIEKRYHDQLSEVCYFVITDSIMRDKELNRDLVSNGNQAIKEILEDI